MNDLISLEVEILSLYNKLCLLEIRGEKSSDSYHSTLTDLKKTLSEETEFLKRFDIRTIDFNELQKELKYINGNREAIKMRIMSLITSVMTKNISEQANTCDVDISHVITQEIGADVVMFITKYLCGLIKSEQDANIIKIIIINFYDLCHTQPRLGAMLLEDSFEIRDEYFKSCYFVADILKIDRIYTQEIIDNYCNLLFFRELTRVFYEKRNLNLETREFSLKLLSCSFNALFTMFSDEAFAQARESFETMTEEQQLTAHPNYEYVVNLFKQFNKSQDKVATITFGKPL